MNDMHNTIYSAEFAKRLCDEYNSLTNRINRSIKEAVSEGMYQTSVVLANGCSDYDRIVECVTQFENLGYHISIRNEKLFNNNVVRISISWG
jgi:hypothetical protein